ncbi:MAG: hypothetical protein K2J58_01400, partial [Muribaculaceae bacterium]|nr:hypothetical protein [Muribaculaceae bacterium]
MINHIIRQVIAASIVGVVLVFSPSCSTGIESTKKIRMTKEDVRLMTKSPEQEFAEKIQGTPLSDWKPGKPFMAMSDRTLLIFEPVAIDSDYSNRSIKGKKLLYSGLDSHVSPDLKEECVILFSDGERLLRYRTGKPTSEALSSIDSSRLPLMSDLTLIDQWRQKTIGSSFWTKSNLWYDVCGNRMPGLKFAKVTVTDLLPAIGDFP